MFVLSIAAVHGVAAKSIDPSPGQGWRLEEPPLPSIDRIARVCEDRRPSCEATCMLSSPKPGQRWRSSRYPPHVNLTVCERCECTLCAICAKPANTWTAPSGQILESVTTATEPRFTFAYNPFDADMHRMRKTHVLEPLLTQAWYEETVECCRKKDALIVDVGGNFGWYTLYSLALGCSVAVFEPIPEFYTVMRLGIGLNPGFAKRTTLYANVVYDTPGNYTLRVPKTVAGRSRTLGMTGMSGAAGILKADWTAKAYTHQASSVRIDDLVQRDVCLLKADVEGYEPQVLQTAQQLLTRFKVPSLQLEMTKTPRSANQTCAAIKMLEHLDALGYEFRQVNQKAVDKAIPPPAGTWAKNMGQAWEQLTPFPSAKKEGLGLGRKGSAMARAYRVDFKSFSTNLIGRLKPERRVPHLPPWPSLVC